MSVALENQEISSRLAAIARRYVTQYRGQPDRQRWLGYERLKRELGSTIVGAGRGDDYAALHDVAVEIYLSGVSL